MEINKCPICGRNLVLHNHYQNYFEYDIDDDGNISRTCILPENNKALSIKAVCKFCEKEWNCEIDSKEHKVKHISFMRR